MTDKGKKIVKESRKVFQVADEKMFRGFSEEELDVLESYMIRIKENINKEE